MTSGDVVLASLFPDFFGSINFDKNVTKPPNVARKKKVLKPARKAKNKQEQLLEENKNSVGKIQKKKKPT